MSECLKLQAEAATAKTREDQASWKSSERARQASKSGPADEPLHAMKVPPHLTGICDMGVMQDIWEESIKFDISFDNPANASTAEEFEEKSATALRHINEKKSKALEGKLLAPAMNFSEFRRVGYRCQQKLATMFRFEGRMFRLKHNKCPRCHGVSLTEGFMPGQSVYCKGCRKNKDKFTCQNHAFPIWYNDEGMPQWHVPEVLKRLTIAEQMLIQRLSPYIPVLHIRNGVMGLKGHVCSFPQEIGEKFGLKLSVASN